MTISLRHRVIIFNILVLVAANLVLYWPHKKIATPAEKRLLHGRAGPMEDGGEAEMRERIQIALQKLPDDQRKAVEGRLRADRAFFDSIQNLPEQERLKKMEKYFAENPPPQIPRLEVGPPPGGEPFGDHAGGPPGGRLPPPAMRHSLDQHIVDSQKK